MKFFRVAEGFLIPISNEENDIITTIKNQGRVNESSFDEREREVSRKMVSRGLLIREEESENSYVLSLNDLSNIWR